MTCWRRLAPQAAPRPGCSWFSTTGRPVGFLATPVIHDLIQAGIPRQPEPPRYWIMAAPARVDATIEHQQRGLDNREVLKPPGSQRITRPTHVLS